VLKLTTDGHKALRGLSATAELLDQLNDDVLNLCAVQFFCFVAMVAYIVDVITQVRDIRSKFVDRQQRDSQDVPVVD